MSIQFSEISSCERYAELIKDFPIEWAVFYFIFNILISSSRNKDPKW